MVLSWAGQMVEVSEAQSAVSKAVLRDILWVGLMAVCSVGMTAVAWVNLWVVLMVVSRVGSTAA